MKKLLTIAAIAAATSALAVESSNTFGILRVDSTAAQTIVSIPWEAAGGGSIKVKDVVKTANLTIGDKLYYYDTTVQTPSYKMWALTANGWEGATTVANGITPTAGTENDTLARGGALILVRQTHTAPFYLYGQYQSAAASINVAVGSTDSPAYSLVAPATTEATSLDSLASQYVGANDNVMVSVNGEARSLVCRQDNGAYKWGTEVKSGKGGTTAFTPVSVSIPAGEGFWYVSRGGSLTAPAAE